MAKRTDLVLLVGLVLVGVASSQVCIGDGRGICALQTDNLTCNNMVEEYGDKYFKCNWYDFEGREWCQWMMQCESPSMVSTTIVSNNTTSTSSSTTLPSITNCVELQAMENALAANHKLLNNINCSDTLNWNGGAGFKPLGNGTGLPVIISHAFNGTLDGGGFNITGLFINRPNESWVGLFGYIYTPLTTGMQQKVSNVNLIDVSITGKQNVGGLAGFIDHSTITNSSITGYVRGGVSVGGLIGYAYQFGTINNSHSTANIFGGDYTGGLLGINDYGYVTNSHTTGNVTGTNTVGGLIGLNAWSGVINNSHATGNVIGVNDVGGLVGKNYATWPLVLIVNSYSTGGVFGVNNVGGLVGNQTADCVIINSYWSNTTANPDVCIGVDVGSTYCTPIQNKTTRKPRAIKWRGGN